jgi:hypothetical protein
MRALRLPLLFAFVCLAVIGSRPQGSRRQGRRGEGGAHAEGPIGRESGLYLRRPRRDQDGRARGIPRTDAAGAPGEHRIHRVRRGPRRPPPAWAGSPPESPRAAAAIGPWRRLPRPRCEQPAPDPGAAAGRARHDLVPRRRGALPRPSRHRRRSRNLAPAPPRIREPGQPAGTSSGARVSAGAGCAAITHPGGRRRPTPSPVTVPRVPRPLAGTVRPWPVPGRGRGRGVRDAVRLPRVGAESPKPSPLTPRRRRR